VHLAVQRLELVVGDLEPLAELVERVRGLAQVLQLVLRPVDLRVADVVADEAVRLAEQEDGPVTAARVLERPQRGEVHRLDVLPVDLE
jgi:hypothetical protein